MDKLIEAITDSYIFGLEGIIFIIGVVVVSFYFTNLRLKVKGTLLIDQMKKLDKNTYQFVSNVSFPELDLKIDHIIFSVYGIFIINRENLGGSVTGTEKDETWTVQNKGKKKEIDNPLANLTASVGDIAKELDLKERDIHPIICFPETADLNLNKGLLKKAKVCQFEQINETIKTYRTPRLSKTKVAELVEQVEKGN